MKEEVDDPFDTVGPVLSAGPVAEAVVGALRRRNARLRIVDRGAYLRALVPRSCTLLRADVEELLGRPFVLPRELEEVMPSFKGRLAFTADGLLEFALVKHSDRSTFKATVASTAVRHAIANLDRSIQESGARIAVAELPSVLGSEVHLTQLFQNLLQNAIKFRGEAPPSIRIFAEPQDGHWRFAVEDRGVGIDMRYAKKLFTIFQRLHPRDEIHGSGIGLALCQRIVELHGGKIWIESELGKGTTVRFTLPRATAG